MAVHALGRGPGHLARVVGAGGVDRSAYLDFAFGWPRSAYWLDGGLYDNFLDVPGASSPGGAGFAVARRGGVYVPVPANAPLIGDGGLGAPESRQQLYGYAGDLAASAATFSQLNTTVTKGGPDIGGGNGGAKAAATSASNPKALAPGNGADNVTYVNGTVYTLEVWVYRPLTTVSFVQLTGTNAAFGSGQHVNVNLTTLAFNAVGGSATVVAFGDWVRICWQVTALASITGSGPLLVFIPDIGAGRLPTTATAGEIACAATQVKVGPNINDPPILQTSGLAATRTAVAQSVSGLVLPSAWSGFAQFRWLGEAPSAFPMAVQIDDGSNSNRVAVYRSNSGGTGSLLITTAGSPLEIGLGNIALGAEYKIAWRCEAGAYAASVNAGAPSTSASSQSVPPVNAWRAGNSFGGAANNIGNGVLARSRIMPPLTNDQLQALTA